MSMNNNLSFDHLIADLRPVSVLRPAGAVLLAMSATSIAAAAMALTYGLRPDIIAMTPHPMVLLRAGMLLLLGTAAFVAVIGSARPSVGNGHSGWAWALAAALLFPVTAALMLISAGELPVGALAPRIGGYCLAVGGGSALLIGAALTFWLRKGAPTALNRAGWLVGLTAGSFGTFVYSLHCPMNTIYFIGLWYSLAVGLASVAGRLIVPRIIRW
jgi:hypothetical protein